MELLGGLNRIPIMEISRLYCSTYAPAAAAARAPDEARARAYARWTLRGEGRRPQDAAFAAADKLLRRATLVPAPRRLERALAVLLGPRLQAGLRAAHQVQLAALQHGPWSAAACDLGDSGGFSRPEAAALLRLALADFARLWTALRALYPGDDPESCPLFVSFAGQAKPGWDAFFVEEGGDGEAEPFAAAEPAAARPVAAALNALLERAFGHAAFREGQREAVAALLQGQDAAALLATGAGKSLIPQLAALLRPGVGLVIEPLVSVIDDQQRALARAGVGAVGRAGEPGALAALAAGRLALFYASPERLENAAFRDALRAAAESGGVAFVAVDEAHCVTAWGHDFRPALLSLGARARRWAAGPYGEPPLLAMTGTASMSQLTQACAALGLRRPVLASAPLARPELRFAVERCGAREHVTRLRRWIVREPGARFGPGLVFCATVDGAGGAAAARDALLREERLCAGLYTGRAPAREDAAAWPAAKAAQARDFLERRLDWLCCTSAFGLGVHVPGARWTVHLGLPGSMEGFFQEAGRAGRDGRQAVCRLVLHLDDAARARRWFDAAALSSTVFAEHDAVRRSRRDDAWAALSLHRRAYPGLERETADLRLVLAALGAPRAGALSRLSLPGQAPGPALRALGRLERAGLVELWGRTADSFAVLGREDATLAQALERGRAAAEDAYARVEPARRASVGALLAACLSGDPNEALSRALAGLADAGLDARDAPVQGLVLEDGLIPG
jgi:RecQ family ATP-dependent DNA helicase